MLVHDSAKRRGLALLSALTAVAAPLWPAIAAPTASQPPGYVPDQHTQQPIRFQFDRKELDALRKMTGIDLSKLIKVDLRFPTTPGYAPVGVNTPEEALVPDDRYFTDAARTALWGCLQERYPYIIVDAESKSSLLRSCMNDVWQAQGDPCLKPQQEPRLCTDLGYLTSWCGRKDMPANVTPQWVCAQPLIQAVQAHPATDDIAVPYQTESASGVTTHYLESGPGWRNHDRSAYFEWDDYIPLDSIEFLALRGQPAAMVPPIGVVPAPTGPTVIFSPGQPPPAVLTTSPSFSSGAGFGSCREYAVEKFYEFVQLDDWERASVPSDADIFATIYRGNGTIGPFMTATGAFDFRTRANALACDPTRPETCHFDHTGSFAEYDVGARPRVWQLLGTGHPVTTMKNVYAYARQMVAYDDAQPTPWAPSGTTSAYQLRSNQRDTLRGHYTLNEVWHRTMESALSGYAHEHLEDLQVVQRNVWTLYNNYESDYVHLQEVLTSAACSASNQAPNCLSPMKADSARRMLATSRAALDRALAEESLLCPATGPGGTTPCDWAPSIAVDAVHARSEPALASAYRTCVAREGAETLTQTSVERRFMHPLKVGLGATADYAPTPAPLCPLGDLTVTSLTSAQRGACELACPLDDLNPPTGTISNLALAACRTLFTAPNPLGSAAAMEETWKNRPRYLTALQARLEDVYGNMQQNDVQRLAYTGGDDNIALSMHSLAAGGVDDTIQKKICDRAPYVIYNEAVDVTVFGGQPTQVVDLDVRANPDTAAPFEGFSIAHHDYMGWHFDSSTFTVAQPSPPGLVNGGELLANASVGGNLIVLPGQRSAFITMNAPLGEISLGGYSVGAYYPIGPILVYVKGGLRSSVGINLGAFVKSTTESDIGNAGCGGFDHQVGASYTVFARAGAFAAVGISGGWPGFSIDVGVRGQINVVDLENKTTAAFRVHSRQNQAGDETAFVGLTFESKTSYSTFSGSLSVFVEMVLGFLNVPLAEVVIFYFRGPFDQEGGGFEIGVDDVNSWEDRIASDHFTSTTIGFNGVPVNVDECMLQALTGQSDANSPTNDPCCPCYAFQTSCTPPPDECRLAELPETP